MEKNKTGKYLKYAIGEVFLVMIGILLALQVNNWNEKRKANIIERSLLVSVVNDLEQEETRFNQDLDGIKEVLINYEQLYLIGVKGRSDITIENPNLIRSIVSFDAKKNNDYSIISNKLTNEELREDLLRYNRRIKDIEVGFNEYRKVIVDRIRVYLAENGVHKLESLFTNQVNNDMVYVDREKLADLSKTIEFQQLLFEAKLKVEQIASRLRGVVKANIELRKTIKEKLDPS